MYQIGYCACTKTAHILKVSELIVFCLFVALHWKTILFIVANAITGHLPWHCFGQRIFRVPTRQCPAHRAKETVALLTTETPDFILPTFCGLRTPWTSILLATVSGMYYCTKVDNVVDLKQRIVAEWAALDHSIIPSTNAQWCLRLHACIRAAGEDFEHCLQWHYPLFM